MSTQPYTIKQCPDCGAVWDNEEVEDQSCGACGYGANNSDDDQDDELPDEFDLCEPEYYQCLGCQWSGVENPGPICPRCSGATVEGVY